MEAISKVALFLLIFYLGGVVGFFGGYIANAAILRGYRDQVDELQHRHSMR